MAAAADGPRRSQSLLLALPVEILSMIQTHLPPRDAVRFPQIHARLIPALTPITPVFARRNLLLSSRSDTTSTYSNTVADVRGLPLPYCAALISLHGLTEISYVRIGSAETAARGLELAIDAWGSRWRLEQPGPAESGRSDDLAGMVIAATDRVHLLRHVPIRDAGAALCVAARFGSLGIVQHIVKQHCSSKGEGAVIINQSFGLPLRLACESGHEKVVRILLQAGANVGIDCALERAVDARRVACVTMLVRLGAVHVDDAMRVAVRRSALDIADTLLCLGGRLVSL